MILGVGAFFWLSKDLPEPGQLIDRKVIQSTKIYDRTGETILYDIHGDIKRTQVHLNELPPYIAWATITIEDQDFYNHKGINLKGILKAVLIDYPKTGRLRGGSSITQQLIKNAVLSPERTVTRKIKEAALAYRIEQKFTKEEILEMYFNEIPFGSVAYGIEAAAQTYLGKSARDLTMGEAALLAAMPQSPSYYYNHQDELFGRQQHILNQMVEEGYIKPAEAEAAKQETIEIQQIKENIIAPHFVMYVREMLTQRYGTSMVEQGGLEILTTLDLELQKKAEEAIDAWAEKNETTYKAHNASLVALDPKTGEILAMVGSRDYWDTENDGNFNVTLALRQPGSSIKPFIYTAGLQKGFTPETVLFDTLTTFKHYPEDYTPHNYNDQMFGPVTIHKALAGSLNIPAVKTIYLAGIENVIDLLEDFGYTSFGERSRFGLSLVLGGGEVKLLEHTAGFGTLANEGELATTYAIQKIKNGENRTIEEHKGKVKRVLDEDIARQITNILSDNEARTFVFGESNYLTLPDRPVCAKTGTTNDNKDAWTLGFTPSLVAGVWVGNNDNTPMSGRAAGAVVAAPIWHEFMATALKDQPVEAFPEPPEIEIEKPILKGDLAEEQIVRINKNNGKIATEFTPPSLIIEKKYRTVHNILHYVNKDDPQGPEPANPLEDPQYENWETAVQGWAKENGYTTEGLPTEYDDSFSEGERPNISFVSPGYHETIRSQPLTGQVSVASTSSISRVEYYLNSKKIATAYSSPYDLSAKIKEVPNGFHLLKAVVYDSRENFNEATIEINLLLPPQPPEISWLAPRQGGSFYSDSFPLHFSLVVLYAERVNSLQFFVRDGAGQEKEIANFDKLSQKEINFIWETAPAAGGYQIYGKILTSEGETITSSELTVTVK